MKTHDLMLAHDHALGQINIGRLGRKQCRLAAIMQCHFNRNRGCS